jgi:DNA-binding transcriptional MerR regulator
MEQAMSLKDVARLLAVPAYRIEYRLAHGLVPEPSLRVSGRRVFSSQDLANLAASLGVTLPTAEAAAEPVAEPVGV